MEIMKETIENVSNLLNNKQISSVELVKESLKQIEQTKSLNLLRETYNEQALDVAQIIDEKRTKGEKLTPLSGVPIIIKDNINMKDTLTTCSSKFLANYVSPYNATVVDKLIQAGAIIIGKANRTSPNPYFINVFYMYLCLFFQSLLLARFVLLFYMFLILYL